MINLNFIRVHCFESIADVLYNCTIYDNSKIIFSQFDTTSCTFCEFEGHLCNNHNYTELFYSQTLLFSTSQDYMVVNYRWTGNGVCVIVYWVILSDSSLDFSH